MTLRVLRRMHYEPWHCRGQPRPPHPASFKERSLVRWAKLVS